MKKLFFILMPFFLISCYKNDIDTLKKQVVDLQYKFDSLSNALTVNTTILQKRADSLSTALSVTNSKISQTSLTITAAIKTSDSISTQLKAINTQITNLNGQLATANANVNSISAQITTLNQQYSDLLSKYNDLLTLVNSIKTANTNDGSTAAKAAKSGLQLHKDYPAYTSGWYWIKSENMPNALQMYVDMTEDDGGYDFYFITKGPSVSTVTETNGGTALGLDLVMPRSKNHWKAMSKAVLQAISENKAGGASYESYFQTAYGIYRSNNEVNGTGDYTSKIMRHSSYGGSINAADWKVKDGGRWWLRDNTYSEPNGDYVINALLGLNGWSIFPNPYLNSDLKFNDGGLNFSTGIYYLVSTNLKP
jgi:hypothetical protein